MTARLRACGVPVRIAPSPQYLAMGVMPVRPRWGNCTPHERSMGPRGEHQRGARRRAEADEETDAVADAGKHGVGNCCKFVLGVGE